MGLYIYNDYFFMYTPGAIREMSSGIMGPLGPATPAIMVGVSLLMAIPALMIALSVALKPAVSRWSNTELTCKLRPGVSWRRPRGDRRGRPTAKRS